MAVEHGRVVSEDCTVTVLMESNPGGVRREYRSLQKQMCCVQFMTVFFCLTCCLLTLMYHGNPSGCKDDDNLKPSAIAMQMQKQTAESNISEETSHEQKPTHFIRVTTLQKNVSGKGYVTWRLPGDHMDHAEFSLDSDGKSLIIHRPGTYKVSLQILYRGVQGQHYDQTNLSHEIRRYTDGYPIPLTMLIYMETINFSSYRWRKTVFSEGIYSLEAGDRLKVWSEDRSLIDGSCVPEKAFFVVHPHFFS